jgi:hypothetical protein
MISGVNSNEDRYPKIDRNRFKEVKIHINLLCNFHILLGVAEANVSVTSKMNELAVSPKILRTKLTI